MSQTENHSTPEEQGEKRSVGRPPIVFTEEQNEMIRRLASLHCTVREIAYVMQVSTDTIQKKENKELIEQGKCQGKVQLRKAQWRNALDNENVTMQIWLGKQYLNQADMPTTGDDNIVLPWEE